MDVSPLNKCLVCGAPAEYHGVGETVGPGDSVLTWYWYVSCIDCGFTVGDGEGHETLAEAAADWNEMTLDIHGEALR